MADDPISLYPPWPMFTWMRTPLYKQAHASANQDGIFYCGRDIKPPEEWWNANHHKLKLGSAYWVIRDERKGSKCADCKTAWNHHRGRAIDDQRGYWEQPTPTGQDGIPVISLNSLSMLIKNDML